MIPSIRETSPVQAHYLGFIEALRACGFEGDLSADYANRTVLATDNSIYQVLPQGVVYPKNNADLIRIAELAHMKQFRDIVLSPRGGGTGTNGQSLTDGLIVDLSRHMNRILEINPERRWARVEAGVVKDQLNAALKPHGLFFAPELSTSNRATIGGMINTDASGQGSCLYGKTRDHVLELHTVFLDGSEWTSSAIDEEDLAAACERQDRVGLVHRVVNNLQKEHAADIAATFPPLNRCLTGYDLAHIRDENGRFNLNNVLCGSEGTLGFISEAKLNLVPIPKFTALVNISYDDFNAALRDATALMQAGPTSIETVDANVLRLAMNDIVWHSVAGFFPPVAGREIQGVNLVEYTADDEDELKRKVGRLTARLDASTRGVSASDTVTANTAISNTVTANTNTSDTNTSNAIAFNTNASHTIDSASQEPETATEPVNNCLGYTVARGAEQVNKIWAMRKKSVGLLGNVEGEARPVPFVEDTAVPPENLADYIAEFRQLLDDRNLRYGMFGHADCGVLHVRPALDLKDPRQEPLVREITDAVVKLVRKYNGLLWGEHGKGVRSEYAPAFFGGLYRQLQRIKASFDPYNQLNPGKIATPEPDMALLKIDAVATRGQRDRLIPARVWDSYREGMHCNGNGACFNWDPDDAMCPSWKATRERIHSPKGRAALMREWLKQLTERGVDPLRSSGEIKATPFLKSLWPRIANTWRRGRGEYDFSNEVHTAMMGCLACKSCAGQCPIKVDVPTFRSKFLELYYSRYLRPPRDYLIGGLEFMLPVVARAPGLYNFVLRPRLAQALLGQLVGMVDSPLLSGIALEEAAAELGVEYATPERLRQLGDSDRQRAVIVVQDAFTRYFETRLVLDLLELLRRLDFVPLLAPYSPNGKPLHVHGFLNAFTATAEKNAARLNALAASDIPLIGVDPSMTLTYRDEYRRLLGDQAPPVSLIQEWLAGQSEHLRQRRRLFAPGHFRLLAHCTEKTNAAASMKDWQRVFAALGQELSQVEVGCCGMAGTYGHEAGHVQTSKRIYAQSWAPVVNNPDANPHLVATGYSCRSQVKRIDSREIPHPAQALLRQLAPPVTA